MVLVSQLPKNKVCMLGGYGWYGPAGTDFFCLALWKEGHYSWKGPLFIWRGMTVPVPTGFNIGVLGFT